MSSRAHRHTLVRAVRWFDPRCRQVGTWAFILNRISGVGLTVYLFLHLAVLGTLARGPEAYDNFVALANHRCLSSASCWSSQPDCTTA
jgi:succinate dehydrogenase / fumarate reductase, cytochrome b subunit